MLFTILSSIFVTCNAILAFSGVCTLSEKIVAVQFERIDTNGDFILTGEMSVKEARKKIAAFSNKIRSYTLITNGSEDKIIVRYVI